ncbi:hypothetical protein [Streptomyces sp. ISL-11]|uniref:hypothetical protein n=1 Tax=Streptomyces sp. ISL-11 TaxID=2819174 RepID=UPI001BE7C9D4|nr:hypothetical protein [Streptomyces sp. ISL-11]MBT2384128.1 hypothetical protein [Streptomyces sp. ISL-11]
MAHAMRKRTAGTVMILGLMVSGIGVGTAQAAGTPHAVRTAQAQTRAEATLTAVEVTFYTTYDNKDHDTKVFTSVTDNTNKTIGTLGEHFGDDEFSDGDADGPYALSLTEPATWSAMRDGRLRIRIEPVGRDTWKLNVRSTLFFSDGTRRHADQDNLAPSQRNRQVDVPIA